mgnify:CR=1 FL=1
MKREVTTLKVDIALSVSQLKQEDICRSAVIVIDALRATSTIITALHQGCRKVIPVETLGQALQSHGKPDTLLIGERFSKKVPGFDLPNSPSVISQRDLTGKTIVITSTNGTKALKKVKKAPRVLVGSFVNVSHCVDQVLSEKGSVLIVCAGRHGELAIEDGLAAGCIVHLLKERAENIECTDTALLLEYHYVAKKEQLTELVFKGKTAGSLLKTGQKNDIHFCLDVDRYALTGVYQDDGIVRI